jgi:hypothetical protein
MPPHLKYTLVHDTCPYPLRHGMELQEIEVSGMLKHGAFEVGTILDYDGHKYIVKPCKHRKQGQIYDNMTLERCK